MANFNSSVIAAIIATPPTKSDVRNIGSRLRNKSVATTVPTGFTSATSDTIRICRVSSHDSIKSIILSADASGSSSTYDIGVYATGNSGAAVDANAYGTAVAVSSAVAQVDQRFETLGIETINNAVWQDAGVSTEPTAGTQYDLVLTAQAGTGWTAGADVTVRIVYTSGD
jgi:hypothetical protein